MPTRQAEIINSVQPVAETIPPPSQSDRVSDMDHESAAELVSDFRRDVIISAALGYLLDTAEHHGPTMITAEHAEAVARQRIELHTKLAISETLRQEVPEDVSLDPSPLTLIYAFDPELTKRRRRSAMEKLMGDTGGQQPVDPSTNVIPKIEEMATEVIRSVPPQVPLRQKVTSHILNWMGFCSPFTPWEQPVAYQALSVALREEQIIALKEIEENGIPAYSHDEMRVIREALAAFGAANLADEYGLITFDKEPGRSDADKRELSALLSLAKNHDIDEASFRGLVDQRGFAEAFRALASGKAARIVHVLNETGDTIVELPIDPALIRY